MGYEEEMRQIAQQLINEHGDLVEVRCVSRRHPGHIELVFADGYELLVGKHGGDVDITMMKFGYHGTGSRCFHAFLDEAGFNVTFEQITKMEDGTILQHTVDNSPGTVDSS